MAEHKDININIHSNLHELQKRRKALEDKRRSDKRGYTMEGLRLTSLINQLQALQAIQGLQELTPKGNTKKNRFKFSENDEERDRQRQWLTFKADWLQALLEDTVSELEALNQFEGLDNNENEVEKN